jgi:hypothetical protein
MTALACSTTTTSGPTTQSPEPELAVVAEAPHEPTPEELPGLAASQISPVVVSHYGSVGGCHTIEYSGHVPTSGSVTLDWIIQPNGTVKATKVVDSTFSNEQFHECVITVAKNFQFPEAPGTTEVSWRFKFRAPGRDSASPRQAAYR